MWKGHNMIDDNRTLGEIKSADIANLEHVLHKQCKEHLFPNGTAAMEFVGQCLFKQLRKLGVKVTANVDERFVDRMLVKNNVKVEPRKYAEDEDKWRDGIYVYKDNEIVGFISHPAPLQATNIIHAPMVAVKTNISL